MRFADSLLVWNDTLKDVVPYISQLIYSPKSVLNHITI